MLGLHRQPAQDDVQHAFLRRAKLSYPSERRYTCLQRDSRLDGEGCRRLLLHAARSTRLYPLFSERRQFVQRDESRRPRPAGRTGKTDRGIDHVRCNRPNQGLGRPRIVETHSDRRHHIGPRRTSLSLLQGRQQAFLLQSDRMEPQQNGRIDSGHRASSRIRPEREVGWRQAAER